MAGESKDLYGIPPIESSNNEAKVLKPQNNSERAKGISNDSDNILPAEEIGKIDFGITTVQKNEKLVSQLNNTAEGNDSIEGLLAKNEQIQLLLSEVLSDYKNYISTDKENLKTLINQENAIIENEDQSKMIESMYEYMLNNDNESEFESFIMTSSINTIKTYLSSHIDKNGKISFISKNEIKARLKIDWFINLYKGYREKHTENSEALGRLEQELGQFNNVASYVKNSIDNGIKQYLGGKYEKDELAQYLNSFLAKLKENENLKRMIDGKDKNSIIGVIRYGIKEYARLLEISDKNPQLKYTGDKVFDMQIRSYLYLYGLIAYPDKFTPEKGLDDSELGEILKSILITDGIIKDDGEDKNGYVKSEKELRREQIKQDIARREEARARINIPKSTEQKFEGQLLNQGKDKSLDIQNATGVEIVQDMELGSQIVGFGRKKLNSETENIPLQRGILMKTGGDFIERHREVLSKYLENKEDIQRFFTFGKHGPIFNGNEWVSFKNEWLKNYPENDASEIDNFRGTLLSFISEYENNLKKAGIFIDEKKEQAHETIKDYALGAVIDNVKDMFQNIIDSNNTGNFINGFKFNGEESAKIENNCLLLYGEFNGETMNIKYDLDTGKLYMNSFINESPGRITIGSTKPDYEIGELKPFESILDDFYDNPTDSINSNIFPMNRNTSVPKSSTSGSQQEHRRDSSQVMNKISAFRNKIKEEHRIKFQKMCGTKLDEIGGRIKYQVETKNTQISVASDLLKTLGIVPDDKQGSNKIINLTGGDSPSDLYKIVQLITSQKNTIEELNTFSNYMRTLMAYIGLNWGKNADHQDKTKDSSKIIFNNDNKQDYISYLRENTQNFDNEHSAIQGKAQFDEKSNIGILKIIEEKFVEGEYPDWKLDTNKIKTFADSLDRDISTANDVAEADKFLKEKLA